MGTRNFFQFVLGFGERDVKDIFATAAALKQELQGERGFTRPRIALNQVEAIPWQTSAQDIVQSLHACGATLVLILLLGSFFSRTHTKFSDFTAFDPWIS